MSEHQFHTPGLRALELGIPVGGIDVETIDGDETTVVVSGDPKLVEQTRVELRGDALVIDFHGRRGLLGMTIGRSALRVQARVPHGVAADLSSASADIEVRGRLASLDAKTASGDITVTAEIDGNATVKTVSGDVRLGRVGGDLNVKSISGDVAAGAVAGSVAAKSVSGDVRVESVREGHATFASVSGDIEIGIASGSDVDVDANTVSGDLSSEVPLASEPAKDGGGATVVVRGKTVSGDVRVVRAA